jgi:translocation and assembly module TamA
MIQFLLAILMLYSFSALAEDSSNRTVSIFGVDAAVQSNIEKRLDELQQIKPLLEFQRDELIQQTTRAMQAFGYFHPQIKLIYNNEKNVIISILPGPQIHVISMNIILLGEGQNNLILQETKNKIPLRVGDPLLSEQYNLAKQNLMNKAENLGYLHANFLKAEILVDEQQNSARISLVFDTGPLFYYGQVQFNPTYISPKLLRRYIPFTPGSPYSSDKVLKLNEYLSNSGYFNSVVVKPELSESQTVPILVQLKPVSKYSYTLGAGYGTDTGVRGTAAFHITPVNPMGHKFNAVAQGSFRQSALQAQYLIPGNNPVTDQYAITSNFSNLNYNAGYSNSLLLAIGQQHNTDHFQRTLSVNALYEDFHYSLQPNTYQFLLYPKATVTLREASNILFSPSGYNLTLNALGSNKYTFSNLDFGQLSFDGKAALMIEPLRLRLFGHTIQGLTAMDDITQLPLSLAQLLGGTDNLKGYTYNSIGPGKYITYTGIELQKEFKKNWYLVGFYDVGDVFNPTQIHLQYDVGGGLMWVSPIGPIKVGLAQPINRQFQKTKNNPRLAISMGPDL